MLSSRFQLVWLVGLFLSVAALAHPSANPAQETYDDFLGAAQAASEVGDYEGAVAAFDSALRKKRTFEALKGRGEATYFLDGREEESLDFFTQAVELRPKDIECRQLRGDAYWFLDRNKEALKDYSVVLKADPLDEEVVFAYARVASDLDQEAKGTRALTRLIKAQPDNAGALMLRAELYAYRGLNKRAIADFTLVEDALRESGDTAQFAYVLALDGEPERARELVEVALEMDPEGAYPHWVNGLCYFLDGDRAKADAAYERAVELEPTYGDLGYDDSYYFGGEVLGSGGGSYEEPDLVEIYSALIVPLLVWGLVIGLIGLLVGLGGSRYLEPREGRRTERGIQPLYDGEHKELFTIYLQNVVFTLLTFGIYRFWAKVRTRRFHYQHTTFAEGRFDYHATGQEKFIGFLKGMAILAPIGAVWYFASDAAEGDELKQLGVTYAFFAALFMIRPLALVGGQQFNLARTSWNNLRLRFTGKVGAAYKLYARDFLFILLTLGLYYPWHICNVRKFKLEHTALGDAHMDFRGKGNELFGIQMGGVLLSWITLGIYLPWFIASRHRFFVKNTKWIGKPFASSLTGKEVLAVAGPGLLVSILTLGLGLPWAMTRWKRLLAVTTLYRGEIEPEQLRSIQDTAANSTLEGVGEAGDMLGEIGDLFGL